MNESKQGNEQWDFITGKVYFFSPLINIISCRNDISLCVYTQTHHTHQTICLLVSDYSSCDHPGGYNRGYRLMVLTL